VYVAMSNSSNPRRAAALADPLPRRSAQLSGRLSSY